ncbi:MAG: hypothetical protein DWC09_04645 [Candidatus Poseidoniales archaeon]|nr:MAG: hypothetical protein DWC09_04645 [Candidatus Poseidoniales archaeon]
MPHQLVSRCSTPLPNFEAKELFFFCEQVFFSACSNHGSWSAQVNPLLDAWLDPVFDEGERVGRSMALWCTIRTFAKHAAELGNEQPVTPVFFVKPNNCIQRHGSIAVSQHPGEVHHEVECVVRLNQHAQPEAIAVGLDLTDRLTQGELRSEQLPWAKGKCFRASAYVGGFVDWSDSFESLVDVSNGLKLNLWVNDALVQSAFLSEMTISPSSQMEELLTWAPVHAGDYLFTGTPSGVGQLHPGDSLKATLESQDGGVLSSIEAQCN